MGIGMGIGIGIGIGLGLPVALFVARMLCPPARIERSVATKRRSGRASCSATVAAGGSRPRRARIVASVRALAASFLRRLVSRSCRKLSWKKVTQRRRTRNM